MKITFLLSTVILISSVSFAQTSATLDASAQSNTSTNAISKSTETVEQGKMKKKKISVELKLHY